MQASGPGPDEKRENREDAAVVPARELPPCPAEQMPGPRFALVRIPPVTNQRGGVLDSSIYFDNEFRAAQTHRTDRHRVPHVPVRNGHRA